MIFTIQKMNHVLKYQDENNKWISVNGYAFIDNWGHCIIIVYGEGRRDALNQHLIKTLPYFNG